MPKDPFISIIMPVKNFERTLDKTFEYLMRVDYPRDSMEIVIADGGSSDGTIPLIKKYQEKYPFIKLVEIPNCPSPGYARNKALEHVKGEFLFFTDGDCAPCKEWIYEMLKHFQRDEKIGIVGGEVYTLRVDKDNLVEAWCEHFRFNMVSPRYGFIKEGYFPLLSDMYPTQIVGHRAYFFVTANVSYRKKAIDQAGAKFWDRPTGEDIDFCYQIQRAGWKLYFAPKAKVDHMHRANLQQLLKVWITYGAAHPPLLDKYAKRRMEIILQLERSKPKISFPFPIKGFIYLGNFHLFQIFGLACLLFLAASINNPASLALKILLGISFLYFIYFTYQFIKWCIPMEPRKNLWDWCKMKYLTNLYFIRGGLKGSLKYKTFCIEPSF
ncbi:MAG: glycosyltransferase [Candidatus Omnitrophica bacterium]|nr:glycosyltransferase [Candidatus Omnitrophota bacterium]MDD5351688.1 glycosyltransferase [Candidatus Omnitrophota bacterium]MDD5550898.1 glycosyltransferase [Candidatus Omnitrophota bacterium]